MPLVIIDTGCANLSSVAFAFERLGVTATVSDNPETILSAERVILPGVGSAPYALEKLRAKNLFSLIQSIEQPMMGICLGMQLLFERLDEGGDTVDGLGLIPGHVTRLDTQGQPSPHMGWNTLHIDTPVPLLDGVKSGDFAYFVHSYAAPISPATRAKTTYGESFSAVVSHKNIYACQFHPERSSKTGARILQNFLKVPA